LITDGAANVIARHDYLPFGEEIPGGSASRTSQWGSGADNINQKFTGQERDSETGLDFFQARYMSAAQGRFNSPDPGNAGADLTNPQSWNGYSYVWNNPLNAVDPTGMDIWFPGPCEDPEDPECGGGLPPCLFFDCGGGGNGGGQRGSGQGGNQTAPSYPLPPGSFPGGETLGLPPGISVPNPLSPQVLLGLDGWDCSFGVCVPGLGPMNWRPPDYYSINLNVAIPTPWTGTILGWSFVWNIDRNGHWYWSLTGAGIGKSATFVSGSATANWINQKRLPTPPQLNNFLTKHGFNCTAGFWGGASESYTPGSGFSTGVGFVTPQAGCSYNYSFKGR
jgi:RHS repeat-associated protein